MIGQACYNLFDDSTSSPGYTYKHPTNLVVDEDWVAKIGQGNFVKIGIQAPPGTKVILNTDKEIIIGRTGIYELDENIVISNLYFVRPANYIPDEETDQKNIQEGLTGLNEVVSNYNAKVAAIEAQPGTPEYQVAWHDIYDEYQTDYEKYWNQYQSGVNGTYKLDPDNPYRDLRNIVVDYVTV